MTRDAGLAPSTMEMTDDPERMLRQSRKHKASASRSSVMLTNMTPAGKDVPLIRPVPFEAADDKVTGHDSAANIQRDTDVDVAPRCWAGEQQPDQC
jgi:hypothetical protein